MLGHDSRGLVRGPRARVYFLTTPGNERERNVCVWRRRNEPRDSREVVHHRAVSHRAVKHALREEAWYILWPGRYEVHAHALAERLGELDHVDNLVVDAQAAAIGADELDTELREHKNVRLVCVLVCRHADCLGARRCGPACEDSVRVRVSECAHLRRGQPNSPRVRVREPNHPLRFLMRVMRRDGGGELPYVLVHEREQTFGRGLVRGLIRGLRPQARAIIPSKTLIQRPVA